MEGGAEYICAEVVDVVVTYAVLRTAFPLHVGVTCALSDIEPQTVELDPEESHSPTHCQVVSKPATEKEFRALSQGKAG